MTIAERINLHKCGYSRAEIDALAAAEKDQEIPEPTQADPEPTPADPEPTPTPVDPAPAASATDPVLAAIKELTQAIYAQNINKTAQPEQKQTVTDLIKNL